MLNVDEVLNLSQKELQKEVYEFLMNGGNNKKLAKIMSKTKGYCDKEELEVKKISFDKIERIAGPEKDMKYFEKEDLWNEKIDKMKDAIKKGWKPPPLIVWNKENKLTIADGSHRIEALKKLEYNEYFCIVKKSKK